MCRKWDRLPSRHRNVQPKLLQWLFKYLRVLCEEFCIWIRNSIITRIMVVPELYSYNFHNRLPCRQKLGTIPKNVAMFFSEACLNLSGHINKQTMIYWSAAKHTELLEEFLNTIMWLHVVRFLMTGLLILTSCEMIVVSPSTPHLIAT